MPFDPTPLIKTEPQLVQDLRALRGLLGTPEQWCQGVIALLPDGRRIPCIDGSTDLACLFAANQLCLSGGIARVAADTKLGPRALAMHRALGRAMPDGYGGAPRFNDSHTHAEVLALIDKAIARESAS